MTKAFKTLIDYGFKELGLNRIEVSVAVENKKVEHFLKDLDL